MDIAEKFNLVAEEYDINRRKFIPCFDEFYCGATKFIAANIGAPKKILDLGAGTGLLTKFWFEHFPRAEYLLIDVAAEMLKIAEQRFSGGGNISCRIMDYTQDLPAENFDAIISAMSIHHLEDAAKFNLFRRIYEKLPNGGVFVNYDQFCANDSKLNDWYEKYWRRHLADNLTAHDLELFNERAKFDRECSAEAEVEMLRRAGFKIVECIYSCQKFSVILAVKEGDYQIDNETN